MQLGDLEIHPEFGASDQSEPESDSVDRCRVRVNPGLGSLVSEKSGFGPKPWVSECSIASIVHNSTPRYRLLMVPDCINR